MSVRGHRSARHPANAQRQSKVKIVESGVDTTEDRPPSSPRMSLPKCLASLEIALSPHNNTNYEAESAEKRRIEQLKFLPPTLRSKDIYY